MQKPVFKNTHNKRYHTKDGIKWDSRACAVIAHVWFISYGIPYVLVGMRGPKGDYPGKLNIPCGYLDWNENLQEAMFREVWEETGLDLASHMNEIVYTFYDQPWFVNAEPTENRQNIAMHLGVVIDINDKKLPELSLENMEKNESVGAYWKTIDELLMIPDADWAFKHKDRLKQFNEHITNILGFVRS